MTNKPTLKKQPEINIREEVKNHIRNLVNQIEEKSLLETVSQKFRDKLDAEDVKKQVLNNKSEKSQMFISVKTLANYIDLRVAKRVRIELKQQNAIPR